MKTILTSHLIVSLYAISAFTSGFELTDGHRRSITFEDRYPDAAAEFPGWADYPIHSYKLWQERMPKGNYTGNTLMENALNVSWLVYFDLTDAAYPFQYGNIHGVNDTIYVQALIWNNSDEAYDITDVTIQDWFYPVIYDPMVDVYKNEPLADTNSFSYRFEHWSTYRTQIICPKPDSIKAQEIVAFTYSVWGLAPGYFRINLKQAHDIPESVHILIKAAYDGFIISKPNSLIDTLNAYATIGNRAIKRKDFDLAIQQAELILERNPNAIAGWHLTALTFVAAGDTSNAMMAYDSALFLLDNWLDPLVQKTADFSDRHQRWHNRLAAHLRYNRWRLKHPIAAQNNWRSCVLYDISQED